MSDISKPFHKYTGRPFLYMYSFMLLYTYIFIYTFYVLFVYTVFIYGLCVFKQVSINFHISQRRNTLE